MHQCLSIADIQWEIFSRLSLKECAPLARTCRTFYEQSNDIVWADVRSFVPFVKCMPSDILRSDVITQNSRGDTYEVQFHFCREPTPSDWQMFCKHMHRVIKFEEGNALDINKLGGYHGTHWYVLEEPMLKTITQFICDRGVNEHLALFPKLDILRVNPSGSWNHTLPRFTSHLCAGTLRTFELVENPFYVRLPLKKYNSAQDPDPALHINSVDVLLTVLSVWPQLKTISITDEFDLEKIGDALVKTLPGLQEVQAAQLPMKSSFINALSDLSQLRTLTFGLSSRPQFPSNGPFFTSRSQLPPFPFAALNNLEFSVDDLRRVIPLLEALEYSETLSSISAHTCQSVEGDSPDSSTLHTLFDVVSRIRGIESFTFTCPWHPDTPIRTELALTGTLLEKLFPLQAMRNLRIQWPFAIHLTDLDMQAAALAWPQLRHIAITLTETRYHIHSDVVRLGLLSEVSLRGIQAFYNDCAHLEYISIVARELPFSRSLLDLPPPRQRAKPLKTLHLACQVQKEFEIDEQETLGKFVHMLFPQLEQFSTYGHAVASTDRGGFVYSLRRSWGSPTIWSWEKCKDLSPLEVRRLLDSEMEA